MMDLLREFYTRLLHEYHGKPLETSALDLLDKMENAYGKNILFDSHRGINTKICMAKAVLERIS